MDKVISKLQFPMRCDIISYLRGCICGITSQLAGFDVEGSIVCALGEHHCICLKMSSFECISRDCECVCPAPCKTIVHECICYTYPEDCKNLHLHDTPEDLVARLERKKIKGQVDNFMREAAGYSEIKEENIHYEPEPFELPDQSFLGGPQEELPEEKLQEPIIPPAIVQSIHKIESMAEDIKEIKKMLADLIGKKSSGLD